MTKDPKKPLRRNPSPLAPAETEIIKKLLWDGMENKEVATVAAVRLGRHIHPSTVSRIKTGKIGGLILWPDGSTGGMPEKSNEDWSPDSLSLAEWPDEYQETILDIVNARRREQGIEEIPSISQDYNTYIVSSIDERDTFDPDSVKDVLRSEDRRRALLIKEFTLLQQEALEENLRESILTTILETTEERVDPVIDIDLNEWIKYEKASWDFIVELIPEHPLVLRALREKDAILAESICIAMYNFRGNTKYLDIENRVSIIQDILKENPAQCASIKKDSQVTSFMQEEGG
jgi:hypothetical protein